jgi:hypothetical protein
MKHKLARQFLGENAQQIDESVVVPSFDKFKKSYDKDTKLITKQLNDHRNKIEKDFAKEVLKKPITIDFGNGPETITINKIRNAYSYNDEGAPDYYFHCNGVDENGSSDKWWYNPVNNTWEG